MYNNKNRRYPLRWFLYEIGKFGCNLFKEQDYKFNRTQVVMHSDKKKLMEK